MKLAVLGLGKLGLPMAVLLAQHHDVIGVDLDADLVEKVNSRTWTGPEPELAERLRGLPSTALVATADGSLASVLSDAVIIIVPTPSKEDGIFDEKYVQEVGRSIGAGLRRRESHLTIILTSTVVPGGTGRLEQVIALASGGGAEFEVLYHPEFIAIGQVVQGMVHPDHNLVGIGPENPERALNVLERIYKPVQGGGPPWRVMSWEQAELAKLMLNVSLTWKWGLVETVEHMAAGIGVSATPILDLISGDRRIGPAFMKQGPPPGGTCLPRDLRAALATARQVGVVVPMLYNLLLDEETYLQTAAIRLREVAGPGGVIGVMGMAYKSGVPIAEESLGTELLNRIVGTSMWWDPLIGSGLGHNLSREEFLDHVDVLCICTPGDYIPNPETWDKPTLDPWHLAKWKNPIDLYRSEV